MPSVLLRRSRRSAPLPDRGALLGERGGALAGVIGPEDGGDDLALLAPTLLQRPVRAGPGDLLGRGHRERAVAGDQGGQLDRGLERAALVGEPVDQADLGGPLGAERLAG